MFPDIVVGTYAPPWMGGNTVGCSLGSMEIDYILESRSSCPLLVYAEVLITEVLAPHMLPLIG